jgi:hypothetical protein
MTQSWQHKERPDGRDFLFLYIYFFSKKEKREMFVADAEATLSTIAFVLSTHPTIPRFSLSHFNPFFSFSFINPVFFFSSSSLSSP